MHVETQYRAYPKSTMATASFMTLSPNTSENRSKSAWRSWNTARTVTARSGGGNGRTGEVKSCR